MENVEIKLDSLEPSPFPINKTGYLGLGAHCFGVYAVKGLAAKVFNCSCNKISIHNYFALNEFEIMRDLYEDGISVPKPEGLFKVVKGHKLFIDSPVLLMEAIRGEKPVDSWGFSKTVKGRAQELAKIEMRKALHLGFIPGFDYLNNVFYLEDEDKVVLYDFCLWTRMS